MRSHRVASTGRLSRARLRWGRKSFPSTGARRGRGGPHPGGQPTQLGEVVVTGGVGGAAQPEVDDLGARRIGERPGPAEPQRHRVTACRGEREPLDQVVEGAVGHRLHEGEGDVPLGRVDPGHPLVAARLEEGRQVLDDGLGRDHGDEHPLTHVQQSAPSGRPALRAGPRQASGAGMMAR